MQQETVYNNNNNNHNHNNTFIQRHSVIASEAKQPINNKKQSDLVAGESQSCAKSYDGRACFTPLGVSWGLLRRKEAEALRRRKGQNRRLKSWGLEQPH